MTNIFKYAFTLVVFALLVSCENEPVLIPEDVSYVAFSKSNLIISEDAGSAEIQLYYTTFSTERAEFSITVSTKGLELPATEGEDFTLLSNKAVFEDGFGYASISLTVTDNDIFEGAKQFYLEISSAPPGCRIGIDGRERILITIADDEHPLSKFKGNYSHNHINYWGEGGEYDYVSVTIIDINPLNEKQILLSNMCGTSLTEIRPVVATIDELNKQIIIKSKQIFTSPNGSGYTFAFNSGIPGSDGSNPEPVDDNVIGTYTIDENTNAIEISLQNWGPKWMEPDGTTYDGWWWYDFFTSSTMTKIIE